MNAFKMVGAVVAASVAVVAAAVVVKRSGSDVRIASSARKVGKVIIEDASRATDTLASAGEAALSAAEGAVEAAGYGLGRAGRCVLDSTAGAGEVVSGNPLSRGVMRGFYAPEAAAVGPHPDHAAVVEPIAETGSETGIATT
jgi:hypothetical protein